MNLPYSIVQAKDARKTKQNIQKEGVGMSRRESYEQRTEELLNPIMEEYQFELVDVEYVKEGANWYLRANN